MTDTTVPGLREQKRIATKRALQVALLRLALERGFDNVTVEEVAQAAQVSPRTFFNYFASKDEAVVAPHGPMELSAEEIARYEGGTGDPSRTSSTSSRPARRASRTSSCTASAAS